MAHQNQAVIRSISRRSARKTERQPVADKRFSCRQFRLLQPVMQMKGQREVNLDWLKKGGLPAELAGLGLVALGAVAQVKFNEYSSAFFGGEVNLPAVFLIVTGSVIFVISFFGCVGAYKENYCMVYTYAVLLGFVLLLEIVVVLVAYLLNIQINLVKPLNASIPNYLGPKHELLTDMWNRSQRELHCCGVHGYGDWLANPILNETGSVPDSCCLKPVDNCGLGRASTALNTTPIYKEGCFDKVVYWAGEHNPFIQAAVAGLGVVELLCVVFACCLARSILREYEAV